MIFAPITKPDDYKIIRAIIKEKIEMKPDWYRFSVVKSFE